MIERFLLQSSQQYSAERESPGISVLIVVTILNTALTAAQVLQQRNLVLTTEITEQITHQICALAFKVRMIRQ